MKWVRVLAALIVCAAITGCLGTKGTASFSGGSAIAAPADPALDPCKLLTQAEASAALGLKVSPGRTIKNLMDTTTCAFATPAGDDLTIAIESPDFYNGVAANGGVPVQGIGAKALWLHMPWSNELYVLKDHSLVHVSFPGHATGLSPAMIMAGKQIASRM